MVKKAELVVRVDELERELYRAHTLHERDIGWTSRKYQKKIQALEVALGLVVVWGLLVLVSLVFIL